MTFSMSLNMFMVAHALVLNNIRTLPEKWVQNTSGKVAHQACWLVVVVVADWILHSIGAKMEFIPSDSTKAE